MTDPIHDHFLHLAAQVARIRARINDNECARFARELDDDTAIHNELEDTK